MITENDINNIAENDTIAANVGNDIADFFGLKRDKNGRYKTAYGTKTAAGLARSLFMELDESFNRQETYYKR
jgi:hypothetical protein